jgi:Exonuclease V - a 5' deoxyribonuclease
MRQGEIIHKELENELHETVPFTQITTNEEIWALRYLNILFGLRELELYGMTVHPSSMLCSQFRENFLYSDILKIILFSE